jgi:hypothetical protein
MVLARYECVTLHQPLIAEIAMNTNGFTNKTENAFDENIETLSDANLDHVSGGVNPQPLPPRDPEPHELRAR